MSINKDDDHIKNQKKHKFSTPISNRFRTIFGKKNKSSELSQIKEEQHDTINKKDTIKKSKEISNQEKKHHKHELKYAEALARLNNAQEKQNYANKLHQLDMDEGNLIKPRIPNKDRLKIQNELEKAKQEVEKYSQYLAGVSKKDYKNQQAQQAQIEKQKEIEKRIKASNLPDKFIIDRTPVGDIIKNSITPEQFKGLRDEHLKQNKIDQANRDTQNNKILEEKQKSKEQWKKYWEDVDQVSQQKNNDILKKANALNIKIPSTSSNLSDEELENQITVGLAASSAEFNKPTNKQQLNQHSLSRSEEDFDSFMKQAKINAEQRAKEASDKLKSTIIQHSSNKQYDRPGEQDRLKQEKQIESEFSSFKKAVADGKAVKFEDRKYITEAAADTELQEDIPKKQPTMPERIFYQIIHGIAVIGQKFESLFQDRSNNSVNNEKSDDKIPDNHFRIYDTTKRQDLLYVRYLLSQVTGNKLIHLSNDEIEEAKQIGRHRPQYKTNKNQNPQYWDPNNPNYSKNKKNKNNYLG